MSFVDIDFLPVLNLSRCSVLIKRGLDPYKLLGFLVRERKRLETTNLLILCSPGQSGARQ